MYQKLEHKAVIFLYLGRYLEENKGDEISKENWGTIICTRQYEAAYDGTD